MTEQTSERALTIRSRVGDSQQFSAYGLKNLQHVLTDWFPKALYFDLTDDTASVDVVIQREFTRNKGVFSTTFLRSDGAKIKSKDYIEDKLLGQVCPHYDPKKSRYDGNSDGFDRRVVIYDLQRVA